MLPSGHPSPKNPLVSSVRSFFFVHMLAPDTSLRNAVLRRRRPVREVASEMGMEPRDYAYERTTPPTHPDDTLTLAWDDRAGCYRALKRCLASGRLTSWTICYAGQLEDHLAEVSSGVWRGIPPGEPRGELLLRADAAWREGGDARDERVAAAIGGFSKAFAFAGGDGNGFAEAAVATCIVL